jgi:hypothetical protein
VLGLRVSGFDLLVDLRDRFRADPADPFDEASRNLYEQLLAPLWLVGQIAESTLPDPARSEPTITATWVLLVRRRTTMFRRFFASWRDALISERLLMPPPTNREQELVAYRLAEHRDVTVQELPRTGKTHTIANLISHLVGHGKRVLVTSQKGQALLVLRDKIPQFIRDLSVAMLGSSAASLAWYLAQAAEGREL